MKRLLFFICTLLCANVLMAQTRFWIGDIQYEITSTNPAEVEVNYANYSITTAIIPSSVTKTWNSDTVITYSVTSIGQYAFNNFSSLTSVTIPNSVTSIGREAFDSCSSLTSVNIPNSVTSIGTHAFRNCSSLTSVTLPENITYIDNGAFAYCSSLTTLNYNAINCFGFYRNNLPLPFSNCPITTINIGDSVQRIPAYFAYNLDLTSITIPNSVTSIGDRAFESCNSLTSITIPNSVTSIGDEAFKGCNSLTSITIPNSVTSIGGGVFYNCSSLTSVILSNNITELPCYVDGYYHYYGFFGNCSSLTSVDIPNSVTSIGAEAFRGCISLTSITIPNSVTSIGGAVFYNCSSLTSVTLSNNITELPCYYDWRNFACGFFQFCSSLTSITIPNSVTSIGNSAFSYCNSLTSVDIPNSVTSIGAEAFVWCSSLTTLNYNAINCNDFYGYVYDNVYGYYNYNYHPFANCPITTINIGDSVQRIPNNFAYNLDSLTSVTIPNSVDTIGDSAFYSCNSLTSITCLADIPPALGSRVFNNTPSNKILYVNCGLKDDYISSWGDYFNSNNIQEIYQYNVVATINNEAFGYVSVENNCYTATLTATANNCYQFVSWNDGNTENPRTINLVSDTSFTALFEEIEFNTPISATICQGQVYTENGFNVSEAGVYTQTLTSVNGCDSIVTLSLNVNPTFNTELSANICQGQVYNENGFNVSEAGVYTQTLTSANGCDSIVTLTLNVNPTFNTEFTATICEGDTYAENNFNESETGVYTQNLQTINGCDSVITLTLNVLPIFDTTINATICEGETYNENDFNVSEAGTYTQNFQTTNGCCIVTLTLNVNPSYNIVIDTVLNEGDVYTENGFNESEIGTYVQYFQTIEGCDSIITLNILSNVSLLDVEYSELSFYPNPTNSKITFSSTIESIEVIDQTGRCVLTFTNAKTINIESLPAGAYYLRLTNNDKAIMRKVIKE